MTSRTGLLIATVVIGDVRYKFKLATQNRGYASIRIGNLQIEHPLRGPELLHRDGIYLKQKLALRKRYPPICRGQVKKDRSPCLSSELHPCRTARHIYWDAL